VCLKEYTKRDKTQNRNKLQKTQKVSYSMAGPLCENMLQGVLIQDLFTEVMYFFSCQWFSKHICEVIGTIDVANTKYIGSHSFSEATGIPIIRSLYRSETIRSTAICNATNSDLKVELSTVFCFLEYQTMGARLRKIKIPV